MPSLFDRPSSAGAARSRTPTKQWDPGLQQFVRTPSGVGCRRLGTSPVKHMDGVGGTVPRVGQRAMERSPGPGQYEVAER